MLLSYVAGVLLGTLDQPDLVSWALAAALAAVVVWWRQGAGRRLACIAILVLLAGWGHGLRALQGALAAPLAEFGTRVLAEGRDEILVVEGTLRGDASPTDYGVSLVVDVDQVQWRGERRRTSGGVRISVGGTIGLERLGSWRAGRRIRAPVLLRRPQAYRNPGVPDQTRALALRGVSWLGSVKSGALVEEVARGSLFSEWAAAARARARAAVLVGMEGQPLRAAIVTAVLVGDRAGIPPDITERLQRAGTFHVIAISGGNIAMLTALVFGASTLARVPPRVGALMTTVAIGAYGFVASGSASVTRATVVALIYMTARALDLRAAGFAVLWSAMCLLLLWSPLALFDPGFLLTSGATIGILLSGFLFEDRQEAGRDGSQHPRGLRAWARTTIAATIGAELALLPVVTTVFSRATLAGLLLNLAAIPLMAIAQGCGLVMVATSGLVPAVTLGAGWVAGESVRGLLASAALVDLWPWLSWRMPPPWWLAVVLYYAAWAAVLMLRVGRWRRVWRPVALAVALACAAWIAWAPAWLPARTVGQPPGVTALATSPGTRAAPDNQSLQIVFFDVGQGDAALVRFPTGEAWVIDTGGVPGSTGFDVGGRIVAPALWALGVRRLEVLALSHGHPDHAGGAPSLIDDFAVREVWEGVPVVGDPVLERAAASAARTGSRWRRQHDGVQVHVGEVLVAVRHPEPPDWERRRVRNDDSLVLEVTYRGFRALFTGDIGRAVEERLARDAAGAASRTTVLKVPHHGSGGSSSEPWLRWLAPSLAVVSVGQSNPFGHPAPAMLARYANVGVPVLRTDLAGAVAVVTDGERVTVSTWTQDGWVVLRPAAGGRVGG